MVKQKALLLSNKGARASRGKIEVEGGAALSIEFPLKE